jgi:hypothetical protein
VFTQLLKKSPRYLENIETVQIRGTFLGLRREAYAKLEASFTAVNHSKLMGNMKPGSLEILKFHWYRSRNFSRVFLDSCYPKF